MAEGLTRSSLRTPQRQLGSESGRMYREARKLERQGFGRAAEQLAAGAAQQKLAEPRGIRSADTAIAAAPVIERVQTQQAALAAGMRPGDSRQKLFADMQTAAAGGLAGAAGAQSLAGFRSRASQLGVAPERFEATASGKLGINLRSMAAPAATTTTTATPPATTATTAAPPATTATPPKPEASLGAGFKPGDFLRAAKESKTTDEIRETRARLQARPDLYGTLPGAGLAETERTKPQAPKLTTADMGRVSELLAAADKDRQTRLARDAEAAKAAPVAAAAATATTPAAPAPAPAPLRGIPLSLTPLGPKAPARPDLLVRPLPEQTALPQTTLTTPEAQKEQLRQQGVAATQARAARVVKAREDREARVAEQIRNIKRPEVLQGSFAGDVWQKFRERSIRASGGRPATQ